MMGRKGEEERREVERVRKLIEMTPKHSNSMKCGKQTEVSHDSNGG